MILAHSLVRRPLLSATQRFPTYNTNGSRTIYAYDVNKTGLHISNKRPIYRAQEFIPDGLKVARNGYLIVASGRSADVIDPNGTLLLRVQTKHTVANVQWTDASLRSLWLVDNGGISQVKWALQGLEPEN